MSASRICRVSVVAHAEADADSGEVAEVFGVGGFHLSRLRETRQSLRHLVGLFQNQTEIVPWLRLLGHKFDRVFKFPCRFVWAVHSVVDQTQVVVGGTVHRIGFDRALQNRLGFRIFFLLDQIECFAGFRATKLGCLGDIAGDGGHGSGMGVRASEQHADKWRHHEGDRVGFSCSLSRYAGSGLESRDDRRNNVQFHGLFPCGEYER